MTSIAYSPTSIQTSERSAPLPPLWFGEVVLMVGHLRKQGVFDAITQRVRFARRRFGRYEVIDFVAVLFGYAISGERTLETFYQAVQPWEEALMALFDREKLPSRSALSRFLASVSFEATEAPRSLFLTDLLARPLDKERHIGQLVDRAGNAHVVFDIDGTRQAARQRALPKTEELPAAQRRLNQVCAPGYTGRKRGEVIRTRTVVSQAHSYHWLGSFGNGGNGHYREELRRALTAIRGYLEAHHLAPISALLRLDGQYGTGAVITDLAGFSFVMRGKDDTVLDRESVQSRLHLPADQQFSRSESGLVRQLYDCPDVPVGPEGVRCRVVVATHPAGETKSRIGHTRQGVVYELFFTHLPQDAFTASDVVALAPPIVAPLNRCLPICDQEQDPDRWCSHAPGFPRSVADRLAMGPRTCAWNWGMCLSRRRCARPSLLPPSQRLQRSRRLRRAMASLQSPCPGKRVVSQGKISPFSPTGRCPVRLASRLWPTSDAEKPMEAYAWSMQPASAVAVPVFCGSSVNGRAAPRRSRAK